MAVRFHRGRGSIFVAREAGARPMRCACVSGGSRTTKTPSTRHAKNVEARSAGRSRALRGTQWLGSPVLSGTFISYHIICIDRYFGFLG